MQRQFKFQPSRYLAAILVTAHGVTLAVLLPLALSLWTKAALASLTLLSLTHHLRHDAWLSAPSAGVALALEGDRVVLTTRDGGQLAGKMSCDSVATPFLTVLNVLPQGAYFARSVVILPDSLDTESFRQLRVWLRWGDYRAT